LILAATAGYSQAELEEAGASRVYADPADMLEHIVKSGDVKGTIRNDLRYHFAPNDVRRHRLISISYISLLPCHGTVRGYRREREGVGGNRKESDDPYYAGA